VAPGSPEASRKTRRGVNYRDKSFRERARKRFPFRYPPGEFRRLDPATVSEIYCAQIAHITLPPRNAPKATARTARHLAGRAAQGSGASAHIDSKTAGPFTPIRPERRRTARIQTPIPLFVYGHLFSFTAAMPYFWGDWGNAKSRERAGNCEPPATWDESSAFPALTETEPIR
jgi:hypothetical protein